MRWKTALSKLRIHTPNQGPVMQSSVESQNTRSRAVRVEATASGQNIPGPARPSRHQPEPSPQNVPADKSGHPSGGGNSIIVSSGIPFILPFYELHFLVFLLSRTSEPNITPIDGNLAVNWVMTDVNAFPTPGQPYIVLNGSEKLSVWVLRQVHRPPGLFPTENVVVEGDSPDDNGGGQPTFHHAGPMEEIHTLPAIAQENDNSESASASPIEIEPRLSTSAAPVGPLMSLDNSSVRTWNSPDAADNVRQVAYHSAPPVFRRAINTINTCLPFMYQGVEFLPTDDIGAIECLLQQLQMTLNDDDGSAPSAFSSFLASRSASLNDIRRATPSTVQTNIQDYGSPGHTDLDSVYTPGNDSHPRPPLEGHGTPAAQPSSPGQFDNPDAGIAPPEDTSPDAGTPGSISSLRSLRSLFSSKSSLHLISEFRRVVVDIIDYPGKLPLHYEKVGVELKQYLRSFVSEYDENQKTDHISTDLFEAQRNALLHLQVKLAKLDLTIGRVQDLRALLRTPRPLLTPHTGTSSASQPEQQKSSTHLPTIPESGTEISDDGDDKNSDSSSVSSHPVTPMFEMPETENPTPATSIQSSSSTPFSQMDLLRTPLTQIRNSGATSTGEAASSASRAHSVVRFSDEVDIAELGVPVGTVRRVHSPRDSPRSILRAQQMLPEDPEEDNVLPYRNLTLERKLRERKQRRLAEAKAAKAQAEASGTAHTEAPGSTQAGASGTALIEGPESTQPEATNTQAPGEATNTEAEAPNTETEIDAAKAEAEATQTAAEAAKTDTGPAQTDIEATQTNVEPAQTNVDATQPSTNTEARKTEPEVAKVEAEAAKGSSSGGEAEQ